MPLFILLTRLKEWYLCQLVLEFVEFRVLCVITAIVAVAKVELCVSSSRQPFAVWQRPLLCPTVKAAFNKNRRVGSNTEFDSHTFP